MYNLLPENFLMNDGKLKRFVLAVFSSRKQGMFPMPGREGIFAEWGCSAPVCWQSLPYHTWVAIGLYRITVASAWAPAFFAWSHCAWGKKGSGGAQQYRALSLKEWHSREEERKSSNSLECELVWSRCFPLDAWWRCWHLAGGNLVGENKGRWLGSLVLLEKAEGYWWRLRDACGPIMWGFPWSWRWGSGESRRKRRTSKTHFVNGQLQGLERKRKPSSASCALLFSQGARLRLVFFFF